MTEFIVFKKITTYYFQEIAANSAEEAEAIARELDGNWEHHETETEIYSAVVN